MRDSGSSNKVSKYVTGFIMTQITAKAGIKKHGHVALKALYQEFLQLHGKGVSLENTQQNSQRHKKQGHCKPLVSSRKRDVERSNEGLCQMGACKGDYTQRMRHRLQQCQTTLS